MFSVFCEIAGLYLLRKEINKEVKRTIYILFQDLTHRTKYSSAEVLSAKYTGIMYLFHICTAVKE